jgi:GNAT superfamily N-acetyltransferase
LSFTIRETTREDVPQILEFIRGIAEYEKMADQVQATCQSLEHSLFDLQAAHCVFGCEDGKPVGFALYFYNFSTFEGIPGLYLEDLFVYPQCRGKGYGKKLLLHLAGIAAAKGCKRMEWVCLDWNEPSRRFYESLGAVPLPEWIIHRLRKDEIQRLAAQAQ